MSPDIPMFFEVVPQTAAEIPAFRERVLQLAELAAAARDKALIASERDFFSRAYRLISALIADADAMLDRIRNEPNFD